MTVYHSKHTHGQDLVEFALVLPILFAMLIGIFELGRAAYNYSALLNAAREGARYAIVQPNNTQGVIDRVKDRAIGINPADLTVWLGSDFDLNNTSDDWSDEDFVQVHVTYYYKPVTPFVALLDDFFEVIFPEEDGIPQIKLRASSTMQREKW